jgi:hypothetical protein
MPIAALAAALALLLIPAQPVKPPCHLEKIHRHRPRVCSGGANCEVCKNKECARLKCPHVKKRESKKRAGY